MTSTIDRDADRELKARHRALWASGDYPAVAAELIPTLGPELVAACGIRSGQRVLDVGAGTGNAAIEAAAIGATVTASDLTPELFEAGRRIAAERRVELDWVEGDAEALPFPDDSFDVVMSCVGAMFAPRHQAVADELVRVCRPGGVIGMINWTPEGFIGNLFATMRPYAAPLPSGATPPPRWGDEQHVRAVRGGGQRPAVPAPDDGHGPPRGPGRLPGVLEAHLRSDDRDLPVHRLPAGPGRRPRS
jgi:SAM-dependent methyltransferase